MLSWFSFNSNVRQYEDSFARSFEGKLLGIKSTVIDALADSSQRIVVVSHFVDTFAVIDQMFCENEIGYEVCCSRIDLDWFETQARADCRVTMTLAEMLEPLITDQTKQDSDQQLTIIVTERHPLASEDKRIEYFCRSLPCNVQWGYFLSFEDAVVAQIVDERAMQIVDMFGMGANELINSKLVSNSLKQRLKKLESEYPTRHPADSAAQWLQQNLPRE